jgi:hypothetical protein
MPSVKNCAFLLRVWFSFWEMPYIGINFLLFSCDMPSPRPSPAKKSISKIQKMAMRERGKFLTRVE